MKLLGILCILGMLVAVNPAQAQKKKAMHNQNQMTDQHYGVAGCGLGSIVFGDKPGFMQAFAATLNYTGAQTFAISTGTSNCGESGKMARASQFIEVNKVSLENDLARGAGESLVSLGEIMGCKNTNFTIELKTRYVPGSNQEQLVQAASQSCQI